MCVYCEFEKLRSHSIHKERDHKPTGSFTGTCTTPEALYGIQGMVFNLHGNRARRNSRFVAHEVEHAGEFGVDARHCVARQIQPF